MITAANISSVSAAILLGEARRLERLSDTNIPVHTIVVDNTGDIASMNQVAQITSGTTQVVEPLSSIVDSLDNIFDDNNTEPTTETVE